MKWKEFFNPDWTKLMVFILLGPVLFLIQSFFYVSTQEVPMTFSIVSFIASPFDNLISPLLSAEKTTGLIIMHVFPNNFFYFVVDILDTLYLYVLASAIVFAYRKIKK